MSSIGIFLVAIVCSLVAVNAYVAPISSRGFTPRSRNGNYLRHPHARHQQLYGGTSSSAGDHYQGDVVAMGGATALGGGSQVGATRLTSVAFPSASVFTLARLRRLFHHVATWKPSRGHNNDIGMKLKRLLLTMTLPLIVAFSRVSPAKARQGGITAASGGGREVVQPDSHRGWRTNRVMAPKAKEREGKQKRRANIVVEVRDDSPGGGTLQRQPNKSKMNLVVNSDKIRSNLAELRSAVAGTEIEVAATWKKLLRSLEGTKLDALILLLATSVVIPLFKIQKKSPILGFLLTGTLLGPNGLNWLTDIHRIDMLGELGVVFFLFEMGLDLSLERLRAMKRDVFGLGTTTFAATTVLGTLLSRACGLPLAASIAISSSLSLSSSAFVLQLLKDKDAMGTRYGKAAFGILLLQDLAVVPVLVVIELLSGPSAAIGKALSVAAIKAVFTLSTMSMLGKRILDPLFNFVARSNSEEAFISIILSTVFLMSFITQGIGLSNTLGAFLAGLLLAETRYRYQVEADIAPYRGVLLGFFFITVGFSIDLKLLIKEAPTILAILTAMVTTKASVITASSLFFGLALGPALQTGLLNSQGGEFAFVAFAVAERSGLISPSLKKLLLSSVALSMAITPALAGAGEKIAHHLESKKERQKMKMSTDESMTTTAKAGAEGGKRGSGDGGKERDNKDDFVLVCGYGRVGKLVCEMLDRKNVRYVAIDNSPKRTIEARNKGLPVYFGDVNRPEVLKYFKAGSAKTCVLTVDDVSATNKAIVSIRKQFPHLPVIARANNQQHKMRIESEYDDVHAMCPILPEDSLVFTLPFGGSVLESVGLSRCEVESVLEEFGHQFIDTNPGVKEFFSRFQRRPPPSVVPSKNEILDTIDTALEDEEELVSTLPVVVDDDDAVVTGGDLSN